MSWMSRPNPRARVWQTTTFRLAVVLAAAFGLGTALLLLALDLAIGRFAETTARDALSDQLAVLRAEADAGGSAALIPALRARASEQPERFRYLIVTPEGERLDAGLPLAASQAEGWGRLRIPSRTEQPGSRPFEIEILYVAGRADDGALIAVGRDTYALEELREWLHRLAVWGGAALAVLATAAGALGGVLFLKRLQRVSEAAERVVKGDLDERLPSLGFGREFDLLADTLNHMLERLQGAMGALRQVSSDVAHDLRTPLTRLRNTLEDARRAPERDALLDEAIAETDQLLEVFGALLHLAQIEGAAERRLAPVDLARTAREVTDAYRAAAEQAGRDLALACDQGATVAGDRTLLAQLIANLIDNALSHGAGGTRVLVGVQVTPQGIRLSVADDGPGVPAEALERLTQRFFRLDHARNSPGAGLGLSMAAAIAAYHGADLRIENRDPGLCVSVRFPAGGAL